MPIVIAVIATELFVVISIALYIDGRRPRPSVFIRGEYLFGIVATSVVSLLIFAVGSYIATLWHWWNEGVEFPNLPVTIGSLVVTAVIVKKLIPRIRAARDAFAAAEQAKTGTPPTLPQAA